MNQTETVATSLAAHEYSIPCSTQRCDCDQDAAFAVWISHGTPKCDTEMYYCPEHLSEWLVIFGTWLAHHTSDICISCSAPVVGNLESNLRVIPL